MQLANQSLSVQQTRENSGCFCRCGRRFTRSTRTVPRTSLSGTPLWLKTWNREPKIPQVCMEILTVLLFCTCVRKQICANSICGKPAFCFLSPSCGVDRPGYRVSCWRHSGNDISVHRHRRAGRGQSEATPQEATGGQHQGAAARRRICRNSERVRATSSIPFQPGSVVLWFCSECPFENYIFSRTISRTRTTLLNILQLRPFFLLTVCCIPFPPHFGSFFLVHAEAPGIHAGECLLIFWLQNLRA